MHAMNKIELDPFALLTKVLIRKFCNPHFLWKIIWNLGLFGLICRALIVILFVATAYLIASFKYSALINKVTKNRNRILRGSYKYFFSPLFSYNSQCISWGSPQDFVRGTLTLCNIIKGKACRGFEGKSGFYFSSSAD